MAVSCTPSITDFIWLAYILIVFIIIFFYYSCCCCRAKQYPAVTVESYSNILAARGYNPNAKVKKHKHVLSELVLKRDLKTKSIWHNEWRRDFRVYFRNEHALISIFSGHNLHPFRKCDRILILMSMVFSQFIVGYTFAVLFFFDSSLARTIAEEIFNFVLAIILSVFERVLVEFAFCHCTENCPLCCRKFFRCCGSLAIVNYFACSGAVAITLFILSFPQDEVDDDYALANACSFYINQIISLFLALFLFDPILLFIEFRDEWNHLHPEDKAKYDKRFCCCYQAFRCMVETTFRFLCGLQFCFCCWTKSNVEEEEGVTYLEYIAYVNGEDVGKRQLPESWQLTILDSPNDEKPPLVGDVELEITNTAVETVASDADGNVEVNGVNVESNLDSGTDVEVVFEDEN